MNIRFRYYLDEAAAVKRRHMLEMIECQAKAVEAAALSIQALMSDDNIEMHGEYQNLFEMLVKQAAMIRDNKYEWTL